MVEMGEEEEDENEEEQIILFFFALPFFPFVLYNKTLFSFLPAGRRRNGCRWRCRRCRRRGG